MRKNVASQVVTAQLISKTDGSDVTTGTTTVNVTGDGGTQGAGAGTVTHEGNGVWSYVPTQAETNFNHVSFQFRNTAAVSANVQVYPVAYDPTDATSLGLARLDAAITSRMATYTQPTGFLAATFPSGTIANTTNITAGTITTTTNLTNAPPDSAGVGTLLTRVGTPTNLGGGATLAFNLSDIEAQTDDIGVAGAGLTALGDTRLANLDATISSRMATYAQPTGFLAATFPATVASTTNITAGTITTVTTLTGHTPQTGDSFALLEPRISRLDVPVSSRMESYTQPTGFLAATFPSGTIANTTNITAGTITTTTNLTNAPTVGDLTATMKASVNAEVDTALADIRLNELLAVDSDIDGAAPPTVGSVFFELLSKTAGSFTFDQTTDSLEALRDRGDAAWITATGFSTHSAADVWTAGTRTLTAFAFTPVAASVTGDVGGNVVGTIGGLTAAALKDFFDIDSTTTYASAVAGSVVKEIADNAGGASLTVQDIVDGVWDEPIASHLVSGSTGASLNGAGAAGDPWTTTLPGAYGAGTAGFIVGTNLDAIVSSRSSHSAADVWAVVTRVLTAGTNIVLAKGTGITGFNDLSAAQVNSEVDTALVDVGLTTTITGRIDAAISTRLATAGYTAPPSAAANADAVWDEAQSGHTTAGTFGKFLDVEVSSVSGGGGLTAAQVWDYALTSISAAGSIGKLIEDNLDAAVSSRSTYAGGDTSGTTTLLSRLTGPRATNLDNLDVLVSSRMATYTQPTGFLAATFPTTVASPTNITAGTITTVTDLTNAPTNGDLTAAMKASVNAEVDSALADVGLTTTVTGRIDAAMTTRATPAQVNIEVLDVIETDLLIHGKTIRQALQIVAGIVSGETSGAGTGVETFKGLDALTTVAIVTVDETGERADVSYLP